MSVLDLCYLSAVDAIAACRAHKLSPVELMTAMIARAEAVEPVINAMPMTYHERALEEARESEARYMKRNGRLRPLEGIPVAIKDETAIKDEITTYGSLIYKDHRDDADDIIVERLKRAGAIIHGRTAAPEFSCTSFTHSRLWGVTRNPWSPEYSPGGSSGGAGASLAAGTTTLANGSDIGGSIRIPASASGVVGFKPPYGRVPEDSPFNLDFYCHEGPMARTVGDCRLFQNVIAGPHPRDVASLRPKLRIPDVLGGIEGWRIAASMDLGYFEIDPEVARSTEAALDVFRQLGAIVEPVDLGWTLASLSAASNYLGHLFGAYIAENLQAHRFELTDYARDFAEFSQTTTAADFLSSLTEVGRMYQTLGPILERCQVLVCPTLAVPSVKADLDPLKDEVRVNGTVVEPVLGWCLTYPFNMLSRCPVMSVPSGFASSGVPTGIQIVGRTYDDVSVFRAAAAYERAAPVLDWQRRRPDL
jgi:Asp-tRNA(Asn)/Glu-tRNA(Gln) amidotransferase A subunit family amidase